MSAAENVTWEAVRMSRLDLADALGAVAPARWDEPSWCVGWRVRDVVGHVVANAEGAFAFHRALPGLVRHGFRVDAYLDADARRRGETEPDQLLARLQGSASGRFLPPGRKAADVLTDVVVHTQDVLRPLGIDRHAPSDVLRTALERTAPQKGSPAGNRAAGLSLRATDMDWAWGTGPEVAGPAEEILLALTGRHAALAALSGPGVAGLGARIR